MSKKDKKKSVFTLGRRIRTSVSRTIDMGPGNGFVKFEAGQEINIKDSADASEEFDNLFGFLEEKIGEKTADFESDGSDDEDDSNDEDDEDDDDDDDEDDDDDDEDDDDDDDSDDEDDDEDDDSDDEDDDEDDEDDDDDDDDDEDDDDDDEDDDDDDDDDDEYDEDEINKMSTKELKALAKTEDIKLKSKWKIKEIRKYIISKLGLGEY